MHGPYKRVPQQPDLATFLAAAPIYGDDSPNVIRGDRRAPNEIWGYGGDDRLSGGRADDVLRGGDDDDRLIGADGKDQLYGDDGDDTLSGNTGDDALYGGTGKDSQHGGAGDDTFFVASADISAGDAWDGGEGYDRVSFGGASAPVAIDLTGVRIGGVESFSLSEDQAIAVTMTAAQLAGFQTFTMLPASQPSAAHSVTLSTGGRIDLAHSYSFIFSSLYLADAATTIDFSHVTATIGTINGGAGGDTIRLGTEFTNVDGNGGDDNIAAGSQTLIGHGGDGDDRLTGSNEVDLLYGEAGSDEIRGGGGNDILDGGGSSKASGPPGLFDLVNGGAGADSISTYNAARTIGGRGNDRINAQFVSSLEIDAGSGDDQIIVALGTVAAPILHAVGGKGHDTLNIGGRLDESATSLTDLTGCLLDVEKLIAGYVRLTVGQVSGIEEFWVADLHLADGGTVDLSATIFTESGTALFLSTEGNSVDLAGNATQVLVFGDIGNDVIVGGDAATYINGDAGNDVVATRNATGLDTMSGGDGIDWIDYSAAVTAVTVTLQKTDGEQDTGGAGRDYIYYFENLRGSAFGDVLTAGFGGSVVEGGDGDDTISGATGADRLVGGSGADTIKGGGDSDHFVFSSLGDFARGGKVDRITDFSNAQRDRIDLSAIDPNATLAGDQKFTFVGTAAFSGGAASYEVRCTGSAAAGFLVEGDVNHDGVADFAFAIASTTIPVKADFML